MKYYIGIFLTLICNSLFSQVPEVKINNRTLIAALDAVIDSLKVTESDKGIFVLTFENIENIRSFESVQNKDMGEVTEIKTNESYTLVVFLSNHASFLKQNIPSFISDHGKRRVFIYSGNENLFDHPKKSFQDVSNKIKGNINENGKKTVGPVWWIKIEGSKFTFVNKM